MASRLLNLSVADLAVDLIWQFDLDPDHPWHRVELLGEDPDDPEEIQFCRGAPAAWSVCYRRSSCTRAMLRRMVPLVRVYAADRDIPVYHTTDARRWKALGDPLPPLPRTLADWEAATKR